MSSKSNVSCTCGTGAAHRRRFECGPEAQCEALECAGQQVRIEEAAGGRRAARVEAAGARARGRRVAAHEHLPVARVDRRMVGRQVRGGLRASEAVRLEAHRRARRAVHRVAFAHQTQRRVRVHVRRPVERTRTSLRPHRVLVG